MPPSRYKSKAKPRKCKVCNNLDPRGHRNTNTDTESGSVTLCCAINPRDLARVPQNGCRFCRLLIKTLNKLVNDWWSMRTPIILDLADKKAIKVTYTRNKETKWLEIYSPKGRWYLFNPFWLDDSLKVYTVQIQLTDHPDQRPPWPSLGTSSPVPSSSESEKSFAFARQCIEKCISSPNHKLCKTPCNYAPLRLIDVGEDGNDLIRLCELNSNHAVSYVALSHCWGVGPLLTTSSGTLKQHQNQIPWDSLPRLFQDAVIVTRRLGQRFLWVDALCIVQDNRKDWETQSSHMSDIYEGAYVTLAATTCPNSDQRFLIERPGEVKIRYTNTTGKKFVIAARKTTDHSAVADHHGPTSGLSMGSQLLISGPLMQRAWVLQEQVLCSRILHYTSTELIFECRATLRCECMGVAKHLRTIPGLVSKLPSLKKKSKIYELWHYLVSEYTLRHLSRPSDKLPAISGIAHKFYTVTKSHYLAGLWTDNLAQDLLWHSSATLQSPYDAHRLDPDVYRAPSFSWASVETQIQFEAHDDDEMEDDATILIDVVEAKAVVAGLNPLGEVGDGWLALRAPVIDGILVAPEQGMTLKLGVGESKGFVDVCPDSLLVEMSVSFSDGGDVVQSGTVRRAMEGEIYMPFKVKVKCLAVKCDASGSISGLVLGLSERIKGSYERMGYFTCGQETWGTKQFATVKIV